MVAGKKLKIHVGLARGRKGAEKQMDLATARQKAFELVAVAKKHGANPKKIADKVEASELTFGQVWDGYLKHLKERSEPIKRNSELSLLKARDKFENWEDRKVRLVTAAAIVKRFDLHAIERGHRTAAEAMGRWATAAVNHANENEVHDAHAEGRTPSLTYNPFTILGTKRNIGTPSSSSGTTRRRAFAMAIRDRDPRRASQASVGLIQRHGLSARHQPLRPRNDAWQMRRRHLESVGGNGKLDTPQ